MLNGYIRRNLFGLAITGGLAVLAALAVFFLSSSSVRAQAPGFSACPPASGWATALWTGANDAPIQQATTACAGVSIDAVFRWDAPNQAWLYFFAGAPPGVNSLTVLNGGQAVFVHASAGQPSPASPPEFQPGIYYRLPNSSHPDALLSRLGTGVVSPVSLPSGGFDIHSGMLVTVDGSDVLLAGPSGGIRSITVEGIFFMGRPSFSPDGSKIAVQATESSSLGPGGLPPRLNIYIVDLQDGKTTRISSTALDENAESPEWFPTEDRIAYSTFSPTLGIRMHIYDAALSRDVLVIEDGWIHSAVSPDGREIFVPISGKFYDAYSGSVVRDIRGKMTSALAGLGYRPDSRYPGQANMGTFPLDADFSPDGAQIVFDGAVERDGQFGVVIFRAAVSGDSLEALTSLIEVEPAFSNFHNYSQLNPSWLGP